ncbi:LamG domain-containing protein, partial [Candidatus Woesearchaeota archaeon]|nr:LamG domain-containing protein [Candidatus Woesearchaeota archaeon]
MGTRRGIGLVLFVSLFLLIIQPVSSDLNCTITTSCNAIDLLHLSDLTNAHAELSTQTNYNYKICCNSSTTISSSCTGSYVVFLKLSNTTNAHVEDPSQNNYAYSACIASSSWKNCMITPTCPSGYECLASISNTSNAHIANCTSYSYKVCCYVNTPPTHTQPLLVSDDPENRTIANLTCYNQSTSDVDGDSISNIFIWYRDGKSIETLVMPFDPNISTTSSNAVPDYSGYNNNGTLGNGNSNAAPIWTTNGKIGGAYKFDGINDEITISDSNSLHFSNEITITAWIYPYNFRTSSNGYWNLIISKDAGASWSWLFLVGDHNTTHGKISFQYNCDGGAFGPDTGEVNKYVEANKWTFVAVTYNSSIVRFYINGSEVHNYSGNFGSIKNYAIPVEIGADMDYASNNYFSFNGTIDHILLFNKSLSPDQILQLYNEQKEGLSNYAKLMNTETISGETWKCSVIPIDQYDAGEALFSNEITIQNT